MGALYSYFFEAVTESEQVDPGTGLTARQRRLIQQCWTIVEDHALEIGVEIMTTTVHMASSSFLREYPKYQEEFPKFRGRDLEELAKDRTFHAHCLNIMSVFSQAVQSIDDAELCAAGLHMAGERHGRRGQESIAFDVVEPLVKKILKARLGVKCTTQVSEALDIAVALIFTEIKHGIDQHSADEKKAEL